MEREGGGFVVVGHLIWEGAGEDPRPRIQPAPSLARLSAPTTVLSMLRQLVLMTSPKSFERLSSLNSRYWSFVDVPAPAAEPTNDVESQR